MMNAHPVATINSRWNCPERSVDIDILSVVFDAVMTVGNHFRSVSRSASRKARYHVEVLVEVHDQSPVVSCFRDFVLLIFEHS